MQSIAKICDFGWSVNSPLLRDTLCGTPLYSSPEVVQKQQYDNKVDIWNIGVLTYELLYGKVPFEIRTEEDLNKVVDDDIYFPRSKPASLQIKDFILRCLSKNPKERFTIARLIDH
jgi:aurora kinase